MHTHFHTKTHTGHTRADTDVILATFKISSMSSARSASILSMFKSKQTTVTAATVIQPLACPPPVDSTEV